MALAHFTMNKQDYTAVYEQKHALRKQIAQLRASLTPEQLITRSREVAQNLELLEAFQQSKILFLYHSMPGEVETRELIARYQHEKIILLPVVTPQGLILRRYRENDSLQLSSYGISEPTGEDFTDYAAIDFVVVPGVAFDRSHNRLGFGKAYYDNLLPKIDAYKAAVCFNFQIFDTIPHTPSDVKMDAIVCQDEIII